MFYSWNMQHCSLTIQVHYNWMTQIYDYEWRLCIKQRAVCCPLRQTILYLVSIIIIYNVLNSIMLEGVPFVWILVLIILLFILTIVLYQGIFHLKGKFWGLMKWYVASSLKLNFYFWFTRPIFLIKLLKLEMTRWSYFLLFSFVRFGLFLLVRSICWLLCGE